MADAKQGSVSWVGSLLNGVCRANFCRVVRLSSRSAKFSLIGKKSNTETSIYLFEYLKREIDRLSKEAVKSEGILSRKATWRRSFCHGAVSTIISRLKDQRRVNTESTDKSRALIVVSDQELEKAMTVYFPNLSRGRRVSIRGGEGYESGRVAGQSIGLHQGLTGRSQRQIA